MKPNYLTNKTVANANIKKKKKKRKRKKEKGKGKNIFYISEMLTVYFLWPYLIRSSTTFFFFFFLTMCVLSQMLTNAARPIPLK